MRFVSVVDCVFGVGSDDVSSGLSRLVLHGEEREREREREKERERERERGAFTYVENRRRRRRRCWCSLFVGSVPQAYVIYPPIGFEARIDDCSVFVDCFDTRRRPPAQW